MLVRVPYMPEWLPERDLVVTFARNDDELFIDLTSEMAPQLLRNVKWPRKS